MDMIPLATVGEDPPRTELSPDQRVASSVPPSNGSHRRTRGSSLVRMNPAGNALTPVKVTVPSVPMLTLFVVPGVVWSILIGNGVLSDTTATRCTPPPETPLPIATVTVPTWARETALVVPTVVW